jgi:hypothetical protein
MKITIEPANVDSTLKTTFLRNVEKILVNENVICSECMSQFREYVTIQILDELNDFLYQVKQDSKFEINVQN